MKRKSILVYCLGLLTVIGCLGHCGCSTFRQASVATTDIPYRDIIKRAGCYALRNQSITIHATGTRATYTFWRQSCFFEGYRCWIVVTIGQRGNGVVKVSSYADLCFVPGYNVFKRSIMAEEDIIHTLLDENYWEKSVQPTSPGDAATRAAPEK